MKEYQRGQPMSTRFVAALAILMLGPVSSRGAEAEAPTRLTLSLQTRGSDGKPEIREEAVDARHVGIVVVDPWNFHWCKTATMRVDALIPRLNRALQVARELGMTGMLCPSDVVD